MIKKLLKKLLFSRFIARRMVILRLKLLNWAYAGLGVYASQLEGGVHPKHRLMGYHRFFC